MIAAGQLRCPVEIWQQTPTRTATGESYTQTTKLGAWDARIEPTGGVESITAEQVRAQISHLLTMRYWSAVRPTMQVRYTDPDLGPRIFEIVRVLNVDERGEAMQLECREVA